jgi:MerR family transcriptional regulator, light-induced transcriptional regulator
MDVAIDALVDEFTERFAAADRFGAAARVHELLAAGVDGQVLREVVTRVQREVGSRWQAGEWTITQEHAATAVAETVLATLERELVDEPVGRVAVVAAEGEWHALPVRLAGQAFAAAGFDTVYLGTGIPATDVARTLPSLQVDAVAVSVTVPANLVGAARTVAAARAAGAPVLLGGWAATRERAAALGATGYASSVDEGAMIVRDWLASDPPAGTAELAAGQGPSARLRAASAALVDAAHARVEDALAVDGGEVVGPNGLRDRPIEGGVIGDQALGDQALEDQALEDQALEDLTALVGHLAAALLLDDRSLFDDEVAWVASLHAGRRWPERLLAAELRALAEVLDDHAEARALVTSVR